MKWHAFDPLRGSRQKRPPIHKPVLVLVEKLEENLPRAIVVGYRKDGAGDKQSPYFVLPGHGGRAVAWCDCLPVGMDDVTNIWRAADKGAGR